MSSINFINGYYDFSENKFKEYDDKTVNSLNVGYEYVEYKGDEPVFKEIDTYFKTVFKNEDVRQYILQLLSNRIKGVSDNKCKIFVKKASNGLSIFITLIKKLFGGYYGTLPSEIYEEDDKDNYYEDKYFKKLCDSKIIIIGETINNKTIEVIKRFQKYNENTYYNPSLKNKLIPHSQPILIGSLENLNIDVISNDKIDKIINFNTIFIKDKTTELKENQEYANFEIEKKINNNEWNSALIWLLIHKY